MSARLADHANDNLQVTAADVAAVLAYEPDTGVFTWKVRRGRVPAGSVAGTAHCRGYIQIPVNGQLHLAHRLAWLITHGEWPKADIDHRNGVKTDNRISNLRSVSRQTNMQNFRAARRDSTSGLLGTSPSRGRWQSKIQINGVTKYLGTYDTAEEAHEAYLVAKRALHGGCTI